MKQMKATPANVSRLLTAAGHTKRTSYPSRIRGWKNWSAGFYCKDRDGYVEVRHITDGYDSAPDSAKIAMVNRYIPALSDRFSCEFVALEPGFYALHVKDLSPK